MNLVEALNTGKWFRRKFHSVAYRYDWVEDVLYFAVDNGSSGVCGDQVFTTEEIVATNWVKNYKPKYFDTPGPDGSWFAQMSEPGEAEPYYDPDPELCTSITQVSHTIDCTDYFSCFGCVEDPDPSWEPPKAVCTGRMSVTYEDNARPGTQEHVPSDPERVDGPGSEAASE